jgi:outer membrane protein
MAAGARTRVSCCAVIVFTAAVAGLWSDLSSGQAARDDHCELEPLAENEFGLAHAVDLALCNNAEVKSAAAAVRIRAAQLGEARSSYWPALTASVTELRENTQYPHSQSSTTDTATTAYGSLTWRLFDFGGRGAQVRSASKLLEAAFGSQDATVQKVLGNVVQAYFDSLAAKALMDSKQQDKALAAETLTSAERRVDRGDGAQSEVLQATTAMARATLESNRADAAYEKSLAVLVYSIGLPTSTRVQIPGELTAGSAANMDTDLQLWLDDARRYHPAIVAARADLEAAREQVAVVRSNGKPTIDLQANYYANGFPQEGLASTRQRNITVGLAVTIPLFDGFLNRYKLREARATVGLKDAILIDTERLTLTEIVKAFTDATTAARNLHASRDLLEAASASQDSSRRRYDAGAADILELLTTQALLADARQEQVRCAADWRSARLRLLATSGRLSAANLQQP